MDLVSRYDHASARHLIADQLGIEIFALGDETHLLGDNPLACSFHLSHGLVLSYVKRDAGESADGKRDRLAVRFPFRHYPQRSQGLLSARGYPANTPSDT